MKHFLILLTIFGITQLVQSQEKTFSILGKVVDSASRLPLSGASVFAQNTTQGTISNSEGKFFIRLPNGGYDLVISYTGYDKKNPTYQSHTGPDGYSCCIVNSSR